MQHRVTSTQIGGQCRSRRLDEDVHSLWFFAPATLLVHSWLLHVAALRYCAHSFSILFISWPWPRELCDSQCSKGVGAELLGVAELHPTEDAKLFAFHGRVVCPLPRYKEIFRHGLPGHRSVGGDRQTSVLCSQAVHLPRQSL